MTTPKEQASLMNWLLVSDGVQGSVIGWAIKGLPTSEETWDQPWEAVQTVDFQTITLNSFAANRSAKIKEWSTTFSRGKAHLLNNLAIVRCPDGKYRWRLPAPDYTGAVACENELREKRNALKR